MLLQKYESVTHKDFTSIKKIKAHFSLKTGVKPIFTKCRPVLFKILPLVEKELLDLTKVEVLEKIPSSLWATSIVLVLKKNNHIRICEDFSITI